MEQRIGLVMIVCTSLLPSLVLCGSLAVYTGLDCKPPSPPQNGQIELTEDWMRHKLAIFQCDPGYALVGPPVLHCVGNSWNDTEPTCTVKDCLAHYKAGSVKDGIYGVMPDGVTPRLVYCDMTTAGGGWTVFQRRINNNTDFYQHWHKYKYGFGDIRENFWLGLQTLHHLTANNTELYIHMEADYGDKRYARYAKFHVGAERDRFRLTVDKYTGTAGDSMTYNNRQMFSARDIDNDQRRSYSCAVQTRGAWWHKNCGYSNLNGLYLDGQYTGMAYMGIVWNSYKGSQYSLKYVRMMLRRKMV